VTPEDNSQERDTPGFLLTGVTRSDPKQAFAPLKGRIAGSSMICFIFFQERWPGEPDVPEKAKISSPCRGQHFLSV
jgi:hypothetical protein